MFGGAKDCGNFLAAESHGKYPLPSSITHEGTLYNHYFTGTKEVGFSWFFLVLLVLIFSSSQCPLLLKML